MNWFSSLAQYFIFPDNDTTLLLWQILVSLSGGPTLKVLLRYKAPLAGTDCNNIKLLSAYCPWKKKAVSSPAVNAVFSEGLVSTRLTVWLTISVSSSRHIYVCGISAVLIWGVAAGNPTHCTWRPQIISCSDASDWKKIVSWQIICKNLFQSRIFVQKKNMATSKIINLGTFRKFLSAKKCLNFPGYMFFFFSLRWHSSPWIYWTPGRRRISSAHPQGLSVGSPTFQYRVQRGSNNIRQCVD